MSIMLTAAALAAWCWIALSLLPAGAEARMPLPYMIALIPLLWVPLAALAALAAWLHLWGAACCALAAAIASVLRRFGHRNGLRDRRQEPTYGTLRVMTLNCRYGRADAHAIMRHIRERDIDVLALQEVSDALMARLNEAGIGDRLPHRQTGTRHDSDNGGYNALLTRIEPVDSMPNAVDIPAAEVPAIELDMGGRTIALASAHPKSPMRGCRQWSAGIRGLAAITRFATQDARHIAVVLGDLNSSIDHPSFRALLASGLQDASLDRGAGPTLTFPSWLPWPRLELDHALFTGGMHAVDVDSFPVAGTDHLALVATLALD